MPRYIIIVKTPESSTEDCAIGCKADMFEAIGKFNEELVAAGVMLGGEGLRPSAQEGYRVHFQGSGGAEPKVEKGPFPSESLMSGWWIVKAKDADEALEWAKKIPFKEGHVELRRISEMDDFDGVMTEEQKERERKLCADMKAQQQK
ncbi:hypothetical protein MAPG_08715 [Magnaporthiopsis poae ATCC 64411]|uniref:YCII-related domain-containing protein n=1 Tax=Magnaporthiopsis poae (strain ATCC 64411 / 73-15) TaxID=644358 RepID=A0A0C4E829_MAGP6|nr:hypothetical protein MAPG_08715 [Magnaporthiopsis poae ATCC 64411]